MHENPVIIPRGEFPLKRSDFNSQEEFYWTYQYKLAEYYYIPLLKGSGFHMEGKRVIDIGCGLGGFTAALADEGAAECLGIDIDSDLQRPCTGTRSNLKYMIRDITETDSVETAGTDYELIVLHDVIEHVPLARKDSFVGALKQFCGHDTLILITFPPYYSPFGLHQQAILGSWLRFVPFLGWLPLGCLQPALRMLGEDDSASDRLREIKDSRMTIRNFRRTLNRLGFRIEFEQFYLVRPTHEVRFGWRTRMSRIRKIPVVNEILNSGALYLVKPL